LKVLIAAGLVPAHLEEDPAAGSNVAGFVAGVSDLSTEPEQAPPKESLET
jgi:hypothetical protein